MQTPVIGITVDNQNNTAASGTYECATAYSRTVRQAGGLAVMLPHVADQAADYVAWCDGLILTGGVDPDTALFAQGEPMHPLARRMDPARQAFEIALLDALEHHHPHTPCLGVCLGMQLMALHAGGKLDQHLPDTHRTHAIHAHNTKHDVDWQVPWEGATKPLTGQVVSHHLQAVRDPGTLRVAGQAPDGVIEAIDDPHRRFYVGVQWHPERGDSGPFSQGLIQRLVDASRAKT